jgi:hypothetical protein
MLQTNKMALCILKCIVLLNGQIFFRRFCDYDIFMALCGHLFTASFDIVYTL